MSNHKHEIEEKFLKKFPVLLQSCLLRADRLAVIWNTVYKSGIGERKALHMMTSSKGNIFHITGLLSGQFTSDQ